MDLIVELKKTSEDYFWASMFTFSTAGPQEQARIRARIEPRLSADCEKYVLISMGEALKQPTSHIYHGSSKEFLAEAKEKFKKIRAEERD